MGRLGVAAPRPRPSRQWRLPALAVVVAAGVALLTGGSTSAAPAEDLARQADADLVAEGRALYRTSCVSCHGVDGEGQQTPDGDLRGPSLEQAGPAGAYYQLTTGRMPIGNPNDLPQRKEPAFSPDEIEALLAYVDTLTEGPAVPDVDAEAGDVSRGGELYRLNCQSCHSATGAGGALSYGQAAPPLGPATPTQIGAAVRSGPNPMPRFGPDILSDEELNDIIAYVEYLDQPDDRGGLALGRLGPIPEGFMIWVGGLGVLLVAAFWMGHRRTDAQWVDPVPVDDDPGTRGADAGGNAPLARADDRTTAPGDAGARAGPPDDHAEPPEETP
ncbi:c-type cytochrome [Iamia sp. SCSIO 61187]|uniref:cytochrome bc1 complex diheme cytochrome c subunit n=1 Tax=Iamia sp. SCSIO 61187 TaxID=2722752 RepID=UPI001C626C27|nr:c-type cytochrome [Iamia sp. SCSIO 61187]QYG91260.1 c-type cytochrome [Iamia sp. SCSIO 61187]